MEVPVINRMTEFEPSHSLISRIFSLFELGKLSAPHRFWKWGALFLALVYAFTSMAYRIKFLILHYHNKSKSLLAATEPLLPNFDDDFCSDDDEKDDVCSSSASSSDGEQEDEDPISSFEDLTRFDEDFGVKGSFGLRKQKFNIRRRRSIGDDFSLSDLVNGNGVVKLWDSSFLGDLPAMTVSPAVIFSAGSGDDGVLGLGLWDFRTSRRKPSVQAEWRSDRRGRVVGVEGGGTGEVYVRDDARGMAVGDVRKLNTPLEKSTATEDDTWWDADGFTDESTQ